MGPSGLDGQRIKRRIEVVFPIADGPADPNERDQPLHPPGVELALADAQVFAGFEVSEQPLVAVRGMALRFHATSPVSTCGDLPGDEFHCAMNSPSAAKSVSAHTFRGRGKYRYVTKIRGGQESARAQVTNLSARDDKSDLCQPDPAVFLARAKISSREEIVLPAEQGPDSPARPAACIFLHAQKFSSREENLAAKKIGGDAVNCRFATTICLCAQTIRGFDPAGSFCTRKGTQISLARIGPETYEIADFFLTCEKPCRRRHDRWAASANRVYVNTIGVSSGRTVPCAMGNGILGAEFVNVHNFQPETENLVT